MTTVNDVILSRLDQHEERLDQQFVSLVKKVDQLTANLTSHVAHADVDRQLLQDIKTSVYGNGKPGYNVRIDRLEQWYHRLNWVMSALAVPLILYAIYCLLSRWVFQVPIAM